MMQESDKLHDNYGWYWMAKDVADWLGEKYYDVYKMPAIEVFAAVQVMQARIQYYESTKK